MLAEYLLVGRVLKPQGTAGLVKVEPITDDPARFEQLQQVWLRQGENYQPVPVSQVCARAGFVYLQLNGAATRDQAESQRGLELYVDRAHAAALPQGRHFICDLIGCRLQDEQGNAVGTIEDVLTPAGRDVLVIATSRGQLLAPSVEGLLIQVDVQNKSIVVDSRRLAEVSLLAD